MSKLRYRKSFFKGDQTQSGIPRLLDPVSGRLSFEDFSVEYDDEASLLDGESGEALAEETDSPEKIIEEAEKRAAEFLRVADETARQHAKKILLQATEESKKIIVEAKLSAQKESEAIKTEARNEVYRTYENSMTALKQATKSVNEYRDTHLKNVDRELVSLVVAIARKLVFRELSINPSCIADVIANSLDYFGSKTEITVRMSPENYKQVTSDPLFAKHYQDLGLNANKVGLIPDSRIKNRTIMLTDGFITCEQNFDTILDNVVRDALARFEQAENDESSDPAREV